MEDNNLTEKKRTFNLRKAAYRASNIALAGVAIPTVSTLFALGAPLMIPASVIALAWLGNRAAWVLTTKKEDAIKEIEEKEKNAEERSQVSGKLKEYYGDKLGVATVQLGKAVGSFVKGAYREIGGREGAERAIDTLADGTEELLKIGSYGAIKTAKAIGNAVEHALEQIQKESNKKKKEKMLDDLVEYVNFVVMDD